MSMYWEPTQGARSSYAPVTCRQRALQPTAESERMMNHILSQHDTMREILTETIKSARKGEIRESGRTFCTGPQELVLGPHKRFPRAVQLAECPVGGAGVIHTHVTHDELLNPQHSLPDMANVLFEGVSTSVVLGTETSEVMLSPSNEQQALQQFQQSLGVDVKSSDDVVDAVKNRRIDSASAARQRVKQNLAPLFMTFDTSFPQFSSEVRQLHQQSAIDVKAPEYSGVTCGCLSYLDSLEGHDHGDGPVTVDVHSHLDDLSREIDTSVHAAEEFWSSVYHQTASSISLRELIIANIIGALVSGLVNAWVFNK